MNAKFLLLFLSMALAVAGSTAVASAKHQQEAEGAVYTMTNAAGDNQVVIFERAEDGVLTLAGAVSTGGIGAGDGLDPLASQGALVLSPDHRWLLAVNAGSDEITVFRVMPDGLALADKVSSGGDFPVSVTVFHDLVYVLNAGLSPNVTGFYLSHQGRLVPLEDSTRALGTGGFAQVGFDPYGRSLVVTDRSDKEILVYALDRRGLLSPAPVISPSNGEVPFGFIFDERGLLLVSEAGSGAVSSYRIRRDETLKVISPSVANFQAATCWIAGTAKGYIYTANTGSRTISAYRLGEGEDSHDETGKHGKWELVLLDEAAAFGNRPIDIGITENGRYLYALDPGSETIDMFAIEEDGSLTDLGTVSGGISIFAQGIAVR